MALKDTNAGEWYQGSGKYTRRESERGEKGQRRGDTVRQTVSRESVGGRTTREMESTSILSTVVEKATALKSSLCEAYGCPSVNMMICVGLICYTLYTKMFPKRDKEGKICAT